MLNKIEDRAAKPSSQKSTPPPTPLAREQAVGRWKQLQSALPAAFLVLAAQLMEFLPGARLDHSHRDFAAGDHGLDCADGPAVFEAAAGALFRHCLRALDVSVLWFVRDRQKS
jgi:hypothetical protein